MTKDKFNGQVYTDEVELKNTSGEVCAKINIEYIIDHSRTEHVSVDDIGDVARQVAENVDLTLKGLIEV